MKKPFGCTILLAVVLTLTSFLLFAYSKTQYEEVRYYKTSFFMGAQDLIDNYFIILDFEKRYLTEKDIYKKEQMLENHSNFLPLIQNHSDSVRALLYKQVNIDQFVVLESNIRLEIISFQNASSNNERQKSVENLEAAIAKYKKFIDDGMKANNICISVPCEE